MSLFLRVLDKSNCKGNLLPTVWVLFAVQVTKMNQRWQEFYSEREKHIKELEEQVRDREERLQKAMRSGTNEEINRRIDQVLDKSQKEAKQVEEMRAKVS